MKKERFISLLLVSCMSISSSVFGADLGDADGNGVLTANDSARVLSYVLDSESVVMTDEEMENADADKSGEITAYDASIILMKVLNSAYQFPDNSSSGGDSEETTETQTETTTEESTAAETETTTEEITETTTETGGSSSEEESEETTVYRGNYYIALADGGSKVYAYSDGSVGDELTEQEAVTVDGDIIYIVEEGTYYVEGELSEGQLSVSSDLSKKKEVVIYLMG
ncbi:MAG: dockerin type I repeat-containing protein, partial [Clostridiales bacterium]|nr:dockerin type I repeat-containing protein [Clostridiales bacterium]